MHKMEELKEMLCEELDKITKKGELSAGSLDAVDKLTHSIKSIATIMAMEEAEGGYSENGGYSGARGRGRNARRDSMGRYSSEGGPYGNMGGGSYNMGGSYEGGSSYARGGNRGGYSRDEGMEELKQGLRDLEMSLPDEDSRRMLKKWMKQIED